MSDQAANTKALPDSKNNNKTLVILVSVLVVAALGFAVYRIESLLLKQAALEQQLVTLTQQANQQAMENGKQQSLVEQGEKSLSEMQGQLAFMQHTLNQIPGARLDDWKLAETEYLLRLANQRVYLQHEFKGAQGLFDAANQVLASLDDPSFALVREQIAKEMLLLGQHSELDRAGIYSSLQAIKGLIHDAILPPDTFIQEPQPQAQTTETTDASLWQQILSLVSVRYRDEAFNAPLSNSQYQLLEHNINLMLEQAQWALLKADNAIYHSSLSNAETWIGDNLRHSNANSLLEKIRELNQIDIQQTTPDVNTSLRMLRQIIQDRTYAPSPIKPAEDAQTKEAAPVKQDDNQKPAEQEQPQAPALKDAPEIDTPKQEQA